jgi:hypothetical protein
MKYAKVLLALIALLVASSALATTVPVGTVQYSDVVAFEFMFGAGVAEVLTQVIYVEPNGDADPFYVYTYQIDNTDSSVEISFFSLAIPTGATIDMMDVDETDPTWVVPQTWSVVEDENVDVIGAEAHFVFQAISPSETGAILWFTSPDPWTFDEATLFGRENRAARYAFNELPVPIPEPISAILMLCGGAFALKRRR